MKVSTKDWLNYINKLRKLSDTAAQKMQEYVQRNGFENTEALIEYAYGLVTKYGEGSAELSCQMYDAIAEVSKAAVEPAIPAATATYQETAMAVQGSLLQSPTGQKLSQIADRLVKQAAADTTIINAKRDGASFAWVPYGDTCPYCLMLGAIGWQKAGKNTLSGNHAKHIHANCDCQYIVDFKGDMQIADYDYSQGQKEILEAAGISTKELSDSEIQSEFNNLLSNNAKKSSKGERDAINAIRRSNYAKNKDFINAQKREAYARNKQSNSKMSDSDVARLAELRKKHKSLENAMLFGSADEAAEFKRLLELEKATTKPSEYNKLFNQQNYSEKQLISWRTEPTSIQRDAISTYTSSQYTEMNGFLRNGGYASPKTKEEIQTLHGYLSEQKTQDVLYLKRGYSTGNPEKRLGEFKNGDIRSIIGNTITDKGFVSATAFEEGGFGGNVVMYIKAPKGTRGAYISDLSRASNEKEFLFDANQNFVIKDAKKVTNEYGFEVIEVFCEVII